MTLEWRGLGLLFLLGALSGALAQRACVGPLETAGAADSLRVALAHAGERLSLLEVRHRAELAAGQRALEAERVRALAAEAERARLSRRAQALEGRTAPPATAPADERAGYWQEAADAWRAQAAANAAQGDSAEARAGRLSLALEGQLRASAVLLDTLGAVRAQLAAEAQAAAELRDKLRQAAAGDVRKLWGLPLPRLGLGYGVQLSRAGKLADGVQLGLVWLF